MATGRTNTVWFIGDSWIFWLREYCERRGIANNLGLQNFRMRWIGQRGMRWHQVVPCLESMASEAHPSIIIVHCGGNDLGTVRGVSLVRLMKHDLQKIMELFPESSIVFSQIAERQQWLRSTQFGTKFEKARRNLNKVMTAFMRDLRMMSIRHFNICSGDHSLFRCDGVHLTEKGNTFFLNNVQAVLMKF